MRTTKGYVYPNAEHGRMSLGSSKHHQRCLESGNIKRGVEFGRVTEKLAAEELGHRKRKATIMDNHL
jgi:hypothetical protein